MHPERGSRCLKIMKAGGEVIMTRGSRTILFAGLFTILILALAVPASADPLDNWHVRHPATLRPDDLRSVAFGNNTFVAVGGIRSNSYLSRHP
jgi:hypothetical protein